MNTPRLRTIHQFCEENPAFTENSIRWHIFNADQNGLNKYNVLKRLGRRVLIDTDRFFLWLDEQQSHNHKTHI